MKTYQEDKYCVICEIELGDLEDIEYSISNWHGQPAHDKCIAEDAKHNANGSLISKKVRGA